MNFPAPEPEPTKSVFLRHRIFFASAVAVLLVASIVGAVWHSRGARPKGTSETLPEFRRPFAQVDGEGLFRAACQGCHMSEGQGAVGAGAYPALARNERLASSRYAVSLVLHGQRAMPPFEGLMSDAQVAAVVNYVRVHFGNGYRDEVLPQQVAAAR
ncbi:MAG TPA: cytochrome c [Polyangiaceae bacterium]|nr:cytochrome c [Polyangiaceae bacterium]